MTSLHINNNVVNFNIYGFDIKIYPNKNMSTDKIDQAVSITPNQEFDASIVPDKDIHFIYNIDYSGSMSEPITYENGRYYSRLEICIHSIIKSLEFLGKLADNGINIYITIVKFSNFAVVVKEFVKLENKSVFNEIVKSIKEITPYYSTNIGESILKISDIENKYSSKCSKIYKILLSDGYSNQGLTSQEIKNTYNNYFNVCIGIGDETQYDVDLLKTLSIETTERSCNSQEEIGDQIIDSVFGYMNIIAQNINLNSTNIPCSLIAKNSEECKKKLRITSYEYCVYNTSNFEIVISGVSTQYLTKAGIPKNSSKIQNYSCNHVNYGSIDVFYVNNQTSFDVIIKFTCDIPDVSSYKVCKTTTKSFRIIQNFIHISNVISELDMNKCDTDKRKKMIHSIYNRLISNKKQLESVELQNDFTYINTITDKFIDIFQPLRFSDDNALLNSSNFTPMRMLSAQSQSGSFACVGRQGSLGYSMGYNYQDNIDDALDIINDDDSENNLNENPALSPRVFPPPITNQPIFNSSLYSNLQSPPMPPSIVPPSPSLLYPSASHVGSIGAMNLQPSTEEIVSVVTPE